MRHTYSGVHEDEVHLHEREHHLQDGIYDLQQVVTRRRERYFEDLAELQSDIDHRAQAETCERV